MTPGDDLWRLCPEGRKQVLIERAQKADMHRPIKLIGLAVPREVHRSKTVCFAAGISQHRVRADRPRGLREARTDQEIIVTVIASRRREASIEYGNPQCYPAHRAFEGGRSNEVARIQVPTQSPQHARKGTR